MKAICAWCSTELDGEGTVRAAAERTTHGICKECLDSLVKDGRPAPSTVLDRRLLGIAHHGH